MFFFLKFKDCLGKEALKVKDCRKGNNVFVLAFSISKTLSHLLRRTFGKNVDIQLARTANRINIFLNPKAPPKFSFFLKTSKNKMSVQLLSPADLTGALRQLISNTNFIFINPHLTPQEINNIPSGRWPATPVFSPYATTHDGYSQSKFFLTISNF